ncbi:MAG: hypothetical protein LBQ46_08745 [Treponema sp.]|jgi:hypothetical protein|nr:hypothetical protein [Treponema sp.]
MLRESNADRAGDPKKYLGAVVGAIMKENVRDYAHKVGFYVVEQTRDTVKIVAPPGFEPRQW